jgi:predicted DsbA family dithiol-disulfide isomerase
VEEGVSKHVEAALIVQAAERRGLMLNKARNLLNSLVLQGASLNDRDELIPDLAAAFEAGMSAEEARKIISEAVDAGDSAGQIRRKLFP